MSDKLKNFIQNNRDEFDMFEPSDDVWQAIQANIKAEKKVRIIPWRKILLNSAAAILIFVAAYGTFEIVHRNDAKVPTREELADQIVKGIPQLYEAELFYNTKVNNKLVEAKDLLRMHPEIANELKNELQQIDSLNSDLKIDLSDNVSNQEVIENLIQNYRIKLQILEDLLSEIEGMKEKTENKKSHEL